MTPYYQDDAVTLYLGDCREILPAIDKVDVSIFDPPYSEHVHNKSRAGSRKLGGSRSGGTLTAPSNFCRTKEFGFEPLTPELRSFASKECGRLTRRWVLAFCDVEGASDWRVSLVADGGLEYIRTGAWVKVGATPQFTGDRPASGFEAIVIAHRKGKKHWGGGGTHALWTHPIVLNRSGHDPRLHTTQKPESLMCELVALFSRPNETILDMFAGSGTTLAAAKRLGRKAIGVELEEQWAEVAAKRLSQGALDLFGVSA